MRIAIAGSSGLIGTVLVESLRADGHEVLRLVRRPVSASSEVSWNPALGEIDSSALVGVEAIINLAGAGVGDHRWTKKYKNAILQSRVQSTETIAKVAAQLKPAVLINGSAIGWYGDTGTNKVDESAPNAMGFLPDVVRQWEAATKPAADAGVRVVLARTGLVMSPKGGAWSRMLPLFKFGLGGKLGSGKQFWSFISIADEVAALKFLLTNEQLSGPVNLTAPTPATNTQITKALGKVLRRPTLFSVPAIALKLVLGEFSQEVLGSNRVLPKKLLAAGFTFAHPDIESATRTLLS
ncbi:MAG: TIGR01777 family protein [Actinobacteria bacterium]|nr:TIGR01777 family protein [Actinomycetota bacterium]NBY15374.1 TIGR01777 family protein [Actinomycetota bacterium]